MSNKLYTLLFFWMLLAPFFASGQLPLVQSQWIKATFEVQTENTERKIIWEQKPKSANQIETILLKKLAIQDADLTIDYAFLLQENLWELDIKIQLIDAQGVSFSPEFENFSQQPLASDIQQGTLVWKNFLESDFLFNQTYEVVILINLFGNICANPPRFDLPKKLPYYGGAILGLAGIGIGQIYRNQAFQEETNYRRIWEEGNFATLDQANSDLNRFRVLTYVGIGILVTDGVLYYLKNKKYQKAVKKFDKFCSQSLSIGVNEFNKPEFGWRIKF